MYICISLSLYIYIYIYICVYICLSLSVRKDVDEEGNAELPDLSNIMYKCMIR